MQAAIYDLNGTNGGKITIPTTTIILNFTLKIPDNVWIEGQGKNSNLVLNDNKNCDMIRNYDRVNGNTGIKISNIVLDGNDDGQVYGIRINDNAHINGITFKYVSDSIIDNCYITNISNRGINSRYGTSNTIINTEVSWCGRTRNVVDCSAYGIWFEGEKNTKVKNCKIHDCYGGGIVFERPYKTKNKSANFVIEECVCWNNFAGIWIENADNGTISNNECYNSWHTGAYNNSNPSGMVIGGGCKNIVVSSNL